MFYLRAKSMCQQWDSNPRHHEDQNTPTSLNQAGIKPAYLGWFLYESGLILRQINQKTKIIQLFTIIFINKILISVRHYALNGVSNQNLFSRITTKLLGFSKIKKSGSSQFLCSTLGNFPQFLALFLFKIRGGDTFWQCSKTAYGLTATTKLQV